MDKKEKFIQNFREASPSLAVAKELTQEALDALNKLEIPTTKDEYWKYTRLGKIVNADYTQKASNKITSVQRSLIPDLDAYLVVFINGYYSQELSTIVKANGVNLKPLALAKKEDTAVLSNHLAKYADHKTQLFTSVNTAFSTNGLFLQVEKNVKLDKPVYLLNITDGEKPACNPRNLLVIEKGAQATVINTFETNSGSSFVNSVTEVVVEENAVFDLYIVQNQSATSTQVNTTEVIQKSNSTFTSGTFTFSGQLIRNNINVAVDGTNCTTHLHGLYISSDGQHIDNHTFIDHKQPNCESNELYKGILNDKSTGVFNGKVYVNSIAQKTNAFQQNQNILLSDDANVYSKPELEIYADDVKCSHGSTTGQFDEEAIFYLRSRGIGEDSARKMLVEAFAADVLDVISNESLTEYLKQQITSKLK